MVGAIAAGPAMADNRCNDYRNNDRTNYAVGFDVRIAPDAGIRRVVDNHYNDRDRGDRNDHRNDGGHFDSHDRR